jgi:hypothetical protein
MSAVNAELIEAAKKGDAAKITECLKNGADIEFVDEVSPLPLHLSVSSAGSLTVLRAHASRSGVKGFFFFFFFFSLLFFFSFFFLFVSRSALRTWGFFYLLQPANRVWKEARVLIDAYNYALAVSGFFFSFFLFFFFFFSAPPPL